MRDYISFILILLLAYSCTTSTPAGKCVGINGDEDPALKYETSVWNVVLGATFVELVIPPVVVVLSDFKCPVGPKGAVGK